MNAASLPSGGVKAEAAVTADYQEFIRDMVSRWSGLCQKFLNAQRSAMFQRDPTPEDVRCHRIACKGLLKVGRMYQALAADPEEFDRGTVSELEGRVLQLEESWRLIHEPRMSEAEADAVLAKAFA